MVTDGRSVETDDVHERDINRTGSSAQGVVRLCVALQSRQGVIGDVQRTKSCVAINATHGAVVTSVEEWTWNVVIASRNQQIG